MAKVLGIESSCDETAASVYDSDKGILSNILFSQIALHKACGGRNSRSSIKISPRKNKRYC